jgi:transposase IS200 family protein
MDEYNALSHPTWECKYHVVFIPKCRRKALYLELRRHLGEVFHKLAVQKESKIEEGHLMPDHVHMLISIPPNQSCNIKRTHSPSRNDLATQKRLEPALEFCLPVSPQNLYGWLHRRPTTHETLKILFMLLGRTSREIICHSSASLIQVRCKRDTVRYLPLVL